MLLKYLISGYDVMTTLGNLEVDITNIAYDNRKVKKDGLFVCIDGTVTDGHQFISDAISMGAKAVLVSKDTDIPDGISCVRVKDTREGLAYVSSRFFGNPSAKFNLIGVTGTKGKTTVTFLIKSILESAGKKTGLVGSIIKCIGNEEYYMPRTTPESYDLQFLFNEMVNRSVSDVIIEVASQGIKFSRTAFCDFDIGVFTNLYRDHIAPNEHPDMEDYFNTKKKLFETCRTGFVNIDTTYGKEIAREAKCKVITFGIDSASDIMAYDIILEGGKCRFKIKTGETCPEIGNISGEYVLNMPGKYNIYNAVAAIGICGFIGVGYKNAEKGIRICKVKGRSEKLETNTNFDVIIDHAHNGDSLENVLKALRQTTEGKIICVFGCGGDRSKERRYGMGEVSGAYADFTIITSDNPRTEDPEKIILDIEEGMKKTDSEYIKITDRRLAIKHALETASANDVVLLAGKGDETYQEFKDKTIHFDEREVVRELLEEINHD